jgi:hypothetical protein
VNEPVLHSLASELESLEFETFEIQDYTDLMDDLRVAAAGSCSCSCSSTTSTCSSTTSTTSCCA